MKNHPGIPQKSNIEDTLALKKISRYILESGRCKRCKISNGSFY